MGTKCTSKVPETSKIGKLCTIWYKSRDLWWSDNWWRSDSGRRHQNETWLWHTTNVTIEKDGGLGIDAKLVTERSSNPLKVEKGGNILLQSRVKVGKNETFLPKVIVGLDTTIASDVTFGL